MPWKCSGRWLSARRFSDGFRRGSVLPRRVHQLGDSGAGEQDSGDDGDDGDCAHASTVEAGSRQFEETIEDPRAEFKGVDRHSLVDAVEERGEIEVLG